jgi:uncharacterized protein YbgA (DUF1722 family)
MDIYPSTKSMPYVYICIHRETNEFYIGYRTKNVKLNKPSHIDLTDYKTSSKLVKLNFDKFDWYIIAEFYTGDDAYDFEQQLIHENWGNPLLLNKSCHYSVKRFRHSGPHSEETKRKLSEISTGRKLPPQSKESNQKRSASLTGKFVSEETRKKLSESHKGYKSTLKNIPRSEETKQKISKSLTGKPSYIRSEETRRKQSISRTGTIVSEETRKKLSAARKGKPGNSQKPESIQKMLNTRAQNKVK